MEGPNSQTTVFDVIASETDNSGKTRWNTVGVAFPLRNGNAGFSVKLFMFPQWFVIKESLRPSAQPKSDNAPAAAQTDDTPF